MFRILALLSLAMMPAPAAANQIMEAYYTEIGPEDRRNSRGARLADPGAVLQQDRANFHRFGIRHAGDEGDVFFANRSLRAQIPGLYRAGRRDANIERLLTAGGNFGIVVFVCGPAGVPTHINVDYADGDGHIGC